MAKLRQCIFWLLYHFAESGIGLIALLFVLLAAAIAFASQWDEGRRSQPGVPVRATITELGFGVSKYRPGLMAGVSAVDEQGVEGSEAVEAAFVAGCKIGSKINAKRAGNQLILQPMPCR